MFEIENKKITMFADYRVPQILNYLGILEYSDHLWDLLKQNPYLEHNSVLEMEIRGCSIYSVELLKKDILELMKKENKQYLINSIILDFYLWDAAKDKKDQISFVPIHKTKSIFY